MSETAVIDDVVAGSRILAAEGVCDASAMSAPAIPNGPTAS